MSGDEVLRLVGDEDCGVGLDCRLCDRGGAPIALYQHASDWWPYEGTDVERVHTITALLAAGQRHLREHHGMDATLYFSLKVGDEDLAITQPSNLAGGADGR